MPSPAPSPSTRPTRPSATRRVFAVLFVIGLVTLFVFSQSSNDPTGAPSVAQEKPAESAEAPPDPNPAKEVKTMPEFSALLDGLVVGSEVDGYKIITFYSTNEGVSWIGFEKDGAFFSVGVWGKGKNKKPLPIQTELYEIGYGMRHPPELPVSEPDMKKVAEQVAMRVRKRETGMEKPVGL